MRSRARVARVFAPLLRKARDWDRRNDSEKLRWRCRHPDPAIDYTSRMEHVVPRAGRGDGARQSAFQGRERHYGFVRPGILFEEYLGAIDHEIQFGEFTFTHWAGDAGYIGKYDAELGRFWKR